MVSRNIWLSLSQRTRQTMAIMLEVSRSGGTELVDGRIVSDGYVDSDLAQINLLRLQQYMKSDSNDFYELFNLLVQRIEEPPINVGSLSTAVLDEVTGTEPVAPDTSRAYDETVKPKSK